LVLTNSIVHKPRVSKIRGTPVSQVVRIQLGLPGMDYPEVNMPSASGRKVTVRYGAKGSFPSENAQPGFPTPL